MARKFYSAKTLFDNRGSYFHVVNVETGATESSVRPEPLMSTDDSIKLVEMVLEITYIFTDGNVHYFEKEVY